MGEQITIFDVLKEESNVPALCCDLCAYNHKGCCGYNEPLGQTCIEGDAFEDARYISANDLVEKYRVTLEDMILIIEQETGFDFGKEGYYGYCMMAHSITQDCKVEVTLDLDRYDMEDCDDWFLSFDFQFKRADHYGGGCCCDTISDVIQNLRRWAIK